MQGWYYGKVKAVKGKEPVEEQKGIFPKSFVVMSKQCDPIADRMKEAIVAICRGYKNSWLEAKEYDTRLYNIEFDRTHRNKCRLSVRREKRSGIKTQEKFNPSWTAEGIG